MLWRLRNTLMRFMAGRYGGDQLNNALIGLYAVLWFVSLFVRDSMIPGLILWALSMLTVASLFFRMFSRNIPRRQKENARFLRLWNAVRRWLRRQRDRIRDVRRWRYRCCPYCKAELRLPIRRGRRTVTCSRCNSPFQAFFL